MSPPSRYRPEETFEYSHRFHAGNVGDVWKHVALVEVLRRLAAGAGPVTYVDSHAGEGAYALGPTGEWTEGIGRLWAEAEPDDGALGRYVELCRSLGHGGARPERYPGSPKLARAVLGPSAELHLFERDAAACAALCTEMGSAAPTHVACEDGLAPLARTVADAERRGSSVVALVDPTFTMKHEWTTIPDAVLETARVSKRASLLFWYPVKSLTRPNAMIARWKAAGVPATMAELVTTPLEHQRQRLNGSGLLFVRPPGGALEALATAAPRLGERCATQGRAWSLRLVAW